MKHFSQPQDKKLAVLGLVALLALPEASVPPEVQPGMPQVCGRVCVHLRVCACICACVCGGWVVCACV